MFVLPLLFLKTTSDELGVYSDFTLLTSIKSWVQVPLLLLLQILLKPEAEPKEVKAPDGGAEDLLLFGKFLVRCCLAPFLKVGR